MELDEFITLINYKLTISLIFHKKVPKVLAKALGSSTSWSGVHDALGKTLSCSFFFTSFAQSSALSTKGWQP